MRCSVRTTSLLLTLYNTSGEDKKLHADDSLPITFMIFQVQTGHKAGFHSQRYAQLNFICWYFARSEIQYSNLSRLCRAQQTRIISQFHAARRFFTAVCCVSRAAASYYFTTSRHRRLLSVCAPAVLRAKQLHSQRKLLPKTNSFLVGKD